jgi:hypothetical protein
MSDLRRERDAARRERDQLRQENADLRALVGDVDPGYARAFALLCDIARLGIRRTSASIATAPDSQPPPYHAAAYHLRNEERREQRKRANTIHRELARLVGQLGDTPAGAELEHAADGPGPVATQKRSLSA